jgi:uncharacterized membrane protein
MTFEAPLWLWLALPGIPAALLAIRLLGAMTLLRRWTVAVARAALIALLATTLAGAASVRQTSRLAVIAVIDASGSVRRFAPATPDERGRPVSPLDRARAWLADAARDRGPDDLLGIVLFDGESLAVAAPTAGDALDRPLEPAGVEGTDIAGALRLARALVPADAAARIVLISDGNQTAGDALAAAGEVSAPRGQRGPTPIDAAPITYSLTNETFIESLDAPPTASAQATVTLRVVMVSTTASRGLLRILEDGEPIDASPGLEGSALPIALAPGRTVIAVPAPLSASRTHRFTAIYEPENLDPGADQPRLAGDTDIANNRAEAFTVTPGRGSILVLDGDGQGNPGGPASALADVWRQAGLDVLLLAPEAMPADLLSLQAHDLVVLQNVAAEALGPEGQALLAAYVRDLGGGLLTLGGRESYGAGGWKGSALEELIPVSLELPERLLAPEVAVVFVLDRSGSMAWSVRGTSRSQMDIATEAAAAAVRSLQPADLVGVITFNLDHQVVVPLAPNADPDATAGRILAIYPDGGTATASALREAYRQLAAVEAKTKHVIILSDGQAMDADVLPQIAQQMRDQEITISTIVIGDGAHVDSMRSVAYYGGGTFYEVINPAILPRVFLKAVRILRTPMVREAPFTPLLTGSGSPLTLGLPGAAPQLLGMNLSQPRQDSTAVYPMVTAEGEPVLAHWQVELGQVVSFLSDAWRWGEPWLDWDGYRTLWTQVARLAARPPAPRGLRLDTALVGERLTIRMNAADDAGRPLDLLSIEATVFDPDGSSRDVQLAQTAPGLYEAGVPAGRTGAYVVVAKPRRGDVRMPPVVAGAAVPDAQEYRRLSSDESLLESIAGSTGGRLLSLGAPADLFDRSGLEPLRASTPLWPVLVAWTLAVLLMDIGTRRIAWDRLISRELRGRSIAQSMAEATRDRSRQAAATLTGLASRRAQTPPAGTPQPAALSELDAIDTARRAQDARRAAQISAAREAMRTQAAAAERSAGAGAPPGALGSSPPAPPSSLPGPAASSPPEGGDDSPLMRAKRRARERLEGESHG